jgi:hypothetical protein
MSGGGHTPASARSVKYIANRDPKNMSSDPRNRKIPTTRSGGRRMGAAWGEAVTTGTDAWDPIRSLG